MEQQRYKKFPTRLTIVVVILFALILAIIYTNRQFIMPRFFNRQTTEANTEIKTYINEKHGFALDYPVIINGKALQIVEGERGKTGYFDVRIYSPDVFSLVNIMTYSFDEDKDMNEENIGAMIINFFEQHKERWPGVCLKSEKKSFSQQNIKAFRNVIFDPISSSCSTPDTEDNILHEIQYYIPDYGKRQIIFISSHQFFTKNNLCLDNDLVLKWTQENQKLEGCEMIAAFEKIISSFRFIEK